MTKNEFNNWVNAMNDIIKSDKTVLFNSSNVYPTKREIIAYDKTKEHIGVAQFNENDKFDERAGKAIAYAKFRGIPVPNTKEELKFARVKEGDDYWKLGFSSLTGATCYSIHEKCCETDKHYYNSNNYFYNYDRANDVASKINFLLKLERLHDLYCPDYKPDWNKFNEYKHYVYYDERNKMWKQDSVISLNVATVYFPTDEIASEICTYLNETFAHF